MFDRTMTTLGQSSLFNKENLLFALRGFLGTSLLIVVFVLLRPWPVLINMAIAALCLGLADYPNYSSNRWSYLLFTGLTISLLSYFSILILPYGIYYLSFIVPITFILIYLGLLGNKMTNLATSVLLSIVIFQDEIRAITQANEILYGLALGGLWYTALSFIVYIINPTATSKSLAASILKDLAMYLRIKASSFYSQSRSIDDKGKVFQKYQAIVDSLSDLRIRIIKNRRSLEGYNIQERKLLVLLKGVTDIFENINASFYEAEITPENRFNKDFIHLSNILCDEMEALSLLLAFKRSKDFNKDNYQSISNQVRDKITHSPILDQSQDDQILILNQLDNIHREITQIREAYTNYDELSEKSLKELNYSDFIPYQEDRILKLKSNISLHSSQFRFAIRFTLALSTAWLVSYYFAVDQGYWIALTVLVLMRSSFITTQSRIWQRIGGTVIGGFLAFTILLTNPSQNVVILLFLLFGFLTLIFIRNKYFIGVLFLTPYILLLFSFFDPNPLDLTLLRVVNTIIGSMIVMIANLLILPNWESRTIYQSIQNTILTACHYLQTIVIEDSKTESGKTKMKVSRKDHQIAFANLNNNFQTMIKEAEQNKYPIFLIYDLITLLFRSQNITSSLRLSFEKNPIIFKEDLPIINQTIDLYSEAHLNLFMDSGMNEGKEENCLPISNSKVTFELHRLNNNNLYYLNRLKLNAEKIKVVTAEIKKGNN